MTEPGIADVMETYARDGVDVGFHDDLPKDALLSPPAHAYERLTIGPAESVHAYVTVLTQVIEAS